MRGIGSPLTRRETIAAYRFFDVPSSTLTVACGIDMLGLSEGFEGYAWGLPSGTPIMAVADGEEEELVIGGEGDRVPRILQRRLEPAAGLRDHRGVHPVVCSGVAAARRLPSSSIRRGTPLGPPSEPVLTEQTSRCRIGRR